MRLKLLGLISLLLLCACGGSEGGSGAGNPAITRSVSGLVSDGSLQALTVPEALGCLADGIVASDSDGMLFSTGVETDCSFELALPIDAVYRMKLVLGERDVAGLQFQNDPKSFPAPVMVVSDGEDPIELGQLSVTENIAIPEFEPALQNDLDGDGINDFDDKDDDNDGIPDDSEQDCDLDGILDDYDTDSCLADPDLFKARLIEVSPRNGEGIDAATLGVSLSAIVQVRVNCHILESSVNPFRFRVTTEGNTIECDFHFPNANRMECEPKAKLHADTRYTATVTGVQCTNGRLISPIAWSWRTVIE